MGNRCAPECAEHDACPACKSDSRSINLYLFEKTDLVSVDQSRSELVEQMTGSWYSKEDGKHMGEIFDEYLYWNFAFGLHPTYLYPRADDKVETDFRGGLLVGKVSLEAQATITWEDGHVWLRK